MPASETHASLGEFHTTASVTQWLGSADGIKLANVTADAIQAAIKEKGETGAVNITIINQPTLITVPSFWGHQDRPLRQPQGGSDMPRGTC